MDILDTIVNILRSLLPRNDKIQLQTIAKDLSADSSRSTIMTKLPSYLRQRTVRRFQAHMIKTGIWRTSEPTTNLHEADDILKNVMALPENCIEKLLNQLKLKLLVEMHNITRSDILFEVRHVDVKEGLKRLEKMIQTENSYSGEIYEMFERVNKIEEGKREEMLFRVKEIERELYQVNIQRLKRFKNQADDARRAVQGRQLVLFARNVPGIIQALVGKKPPKQQSSQLQPTTTTTNPPQPSSRPTSSSSASSNPHSSSTLPSPCLHALTVWDRPNTVLGILPFIEQSTDVQTQLSQKSILQAIKSSTKVVLVVPVQKKLEEVSGNAYLLGLAMRVSRFVRDYERERQSVVYVFQGYEGKQEVEEFRKRVKILIDGHHKHHNTCEVFKHILDITNVQHLKTYKNLCQDLPRDCLLDQTSTLPGLSFPSLNYALSEAAQRAAVDYCSYLFGLCFLHIKDGGLVKYMMKNIEFLGEITGHEKIRSALATLKAQMGRKLAKKVIFGIDSTCSVGRETQEVIRGILEEVFRRVQGRLEALNLPKDHLQIKVITFTNYSSGKQNLKRQSDFTSQPSQLSDFLKTIKPCGGQGHQAIQVLYHQVRQQPQTDKLIILADQQPNSSEQTHKRRKHAGDLYWKGTEFEEEWDAELECREVMARGIPISCLYIGQASEQDDSARNYFENVCAESGGEFCQFRRNHRQEMVQEVERMVMGVVEESIDVI